MASTAALTAASDAVVGLDETAAEAAADFESDLTVLGLAMIVFFVLFTLVFKPIIACCKIQLIVWMKLLIFHFGFAYIGVVRVHSSLGISIFDMFNFYEEGRLS